MPQIKLGAFNCGKNGHTCQAKWVGSFACPTGCRMEQGRVQLQAQQLKLLEGPLGGLQIKPGWKPPRAGREGPPEETIKVLMTESFSKGDIVPQRQVWSILESGRC